MVEGLEDFPPGEARGVGLRGEIRQGGDGPRVADLAEGPGDVADDGGFGAIERGDQGRDGVLVEPTEVVGQGGPDRGLEA